jgi:DNA-binding transcriptional LysR family regulator
VQKLEEDLGFPLFQRNGHRPRLTPAGEEVLKEGRLILQATVDLEERAKRVSEGYEARLPIALDGLLPSEPMLALASEFYAEPGHAETDLRIAHETLGRAWDSLVLQRADLVVGASGDNAPEDGEHHTRLIGTLEFILVAVDAIHSQCAADRFRSTYCVCIAQRSSQTAQASYRRGRRGFWQARKLSPCPTCIRRWPR